MFRQHATAIGVDLDKLNRIHPGSFKPKAEAANAAEKVQHLHSFGTVKLSILDRGVRP